MGRFRLEDHRWDAINCCGCKGCVWVDHVYAPGIRHSIKCPSILHYHFDAYSALGRNKLALALLDGEFELTSTTVELIYKCNLCGACDVGCKRNLDLEPLMVLEALRARVVETLDNPPPQLAKVAKNVLTTNNRYGITEGLHGPDKAARARGTEIIYFPGCNAYFKNTHIFQFVQKLLKLAGIEFQVLPPACCGKPLLAAGMVKEAETVARANIGLLETLGAKVILTACAECFKAWKVDYPRLLDKATDQMNYKTMHITQLADGLLREGRLKPSRPLHLEVAHHDPCNLARLSEDWVPWHGSRTTLGLTFPPKRYRRGTHGEYMAPRNTLAAVDGLRVREFPRCRENALCCGAGGGVMDSFPEFSLATARARVEEAMDMGIDAIVTACPFCLDNLSAASKSGNYKIEVYDITEILAHSLGLEDP